MTAVQANSSSVSRYSFASYKRSPMELAGRPIISAAIPDLKQKPRPTEQADTKYGITAGIKFFLYDIIGKPDI
jgi:hypothetical protein